jgi:hypothetical protein
MLVLTDLQKVNLSIAPVDVMGNPAKVEGTPIWATSDPSLLSLEVAPDGLSAYAITLGPLGTCQVSVTADANLDPDITTTITGILDISVIASEAVSLSITAATPEPR